MRLILLLCVFILNVAFIDIEVASANIHSPAEKSRKKDIVNYLFQHIDENRDRIKGILEPAFGSEFNAESFFSQSHLLRKSLLDEIENDMDGTDEIHKLLYYSTPRPSNQNVVKKCNQEELSKTNLNITKYQHKRQQSSKQEEQVVNVISVPRDYFFMNITKYQLIQAIFMELLVNLLLSLADVISAIPDNQELCAKFEYLRDQHHAITGDVLECDSIGQYGQKIFCEQLLAIERKNSPVEIMLKLCRKIGDKNENIANLTAQLEGWLNSFGMMRKDMFEFNN